MQLGQFFKIIQAEEDIGDIRPGGCPVEDLLTQFSRSFNSSFNYIGRKNRRYIENHSIEFTALLTPKEEDCTLIVFQCYSFQRPWV